MPKQNNSHEEKAILASYLRGHIIWCIPQHQLLTSLPRDSTSWGLSSSAIGDGVELLHPVIDLGESLIFELGSVLGFPQFLEIIGSRHFYFPKQGIGLAQVLRRDLHAG